MITKYPKFTKLTLEHKDEIENFTKKFRPYSDFNFTSLMAWNVNNSGLIAKLNSNLVIKIPDYYSGKLIVSVLGDNSIDETTNEILKNEKQLKLVPETVVKNIKITSKLKITEEKKNHDYVYNLDKLSYLPGKDYKSKRKLRSRFIKKYGEQARIEENLDPNSCKAQLKELLVNWNEQKSIKHELISEQQAIDRLIEASPYLNVVWTGLFVKDRLAGFSVNEIIDKKYANCHFQKALLRYKNSDVYLTTEVSKLLRKHGCEYVNWEQDMGSKGLRQSKSSYNPELHLKKYTISYK